MTIKFRTSLFISILFTILYGIISVIIILLFSRFRAEEFEERLEEKAQSTVKLLLDVQEVDNNMLKIIDMNSINQLYQEKTLIFDSAYHLIYSSVDDMKVNWDKSDFEHLKEYKSFFKKDGDIEVFGRYFDNRDKDYYALVSANDNHGKRKLQFLIYLVAASYVCFTILTWILTFSVVKRQLTPLDYLLKKISRINANNLATRLDGLPSGKNEISLIASEFNLMMDRIEDAYLRQKEFTAQSSHELRTPLARISTQIENRLLRSDEKEKVFLSGIFNDINQLNNLIYSLLLLSKAEDRKAEYKVKARLDEAVYNSIEFIHKLYPDFKVNFDLDASLDDEQLLEVSCNQNLLEIALQNLLKNACLYSDNSAADILILKEEGQVKLTITNSGATLSASEQKKLFQPFMRGANSVSQPGFGLGLRIVHRILSSVHARLSYSADSGLNTFSILFPVA